MPEPLEMIYDCDDDNRRGSATDGLKVRPTARLRAAETEESRFSGRSDHA